jgi:hypothetical protein
MIEHLSLISQATAKDRQALVIVDRAGWHMTKAIRCFSISPSALSLAEHTAPKIYPYSNCC